MGSISMLEILTTKNRLRQRPVKL